MRCVKLYKFILACVLVTVFAGCELIEEPYGPNSMEVKLFARMGAHLQVKSPVKGAITSTTDQTLNIGVVRLDEKNSETATLNYPYFINCQSPLKATLSAPDAKEGNLRTVTSFSTSQFFKNSTDEITYAAWYPWPAESTLPEGYAYSSDANGTTVTFPITGTSDIMYSNAVSGTMSEGFDVMQFKHALSMFRIHVYRSTEANWGTLSSININDLPNRCIITLPKNGLAKEHAIDYTYYTYSTQSASLDLSLNTTSEIPIGFENKKYITEWIAAPAPVSAHLTKLVMSVQTSQYNDIDPIEIVRDFEPGYVYDIVLRFSDKGVIDAQVEISTWQDGEDINSDIESSGIFYNLSAYGTANCYIISAANFGYSFDATIKGNGNTDAMPGNNIETTLNPKYVEVIWSDLTPENIVVSKTDNETITRPIFELETNKIVEGKVLFKVNGNPSNITDKSLQGEGNVLLGVFDKEGEGRQCLWTWHIWITDKPQEQNYTNGYIALDRNLGATAAAPGDSKGTMNGLFYQWGRPTPFRTSFVEDSYVTGASKSETLVTPDVAVSNPTLFYGKESTVTVNSKDVTFYDWIDREQFPYVNNLWGYREEEHEKPIKTIYDPCPQGYHVPYARTWEKLDSFDNNMPSAGHTWPGDNNGVRITIEGKEIWYPFQGFISKDGTYKQGHIHINGATATYEKNIRIVEMWSALINRHDADDIAGKLTGDNEKINDSPYRFMFNADDHAKLSDDYTNRSRGLAVRCVSNNTADVVKDLSAYQTSNCYMVHEDGFYKFKATVRGNGVGSLLPLGGTTTAEINAGLSTTISPVKVDILWWQGDFTKETDFPGSEIPSQNAAPGNLCLSLLDGGILCEDGFVSFHVSNFSKGNVILAAYDGTGANAKILWTWHIWLTDKPVDKIQGNYTQMDRFLGATYAPTIPESGTITWGTDSNSDDVAYKNATLGFYYQWGRKDPIIGPDNINTQTGSSSDGTASSAGWWKKNTNGTWSYRESIDVKPATDIPNVVQDPTAFYTSGSASGQANSQWFSPSFADGYTNVALWGYAVADYSIQGQTFSKTMHDPCPPGYRTPFHHAWRYNDQIYYSNGEWGGGKNYDSGNKESTYDNDKQGMVTVKNYFEKTWYPFCGYRYPTTGIYELVGTEGHMNTGMPMKQYETRTFWYTSTQSGQDAGGKGSAYGMMVRCMKE